MSMDKLVKYFNAGYPAVAVQSSEEARVLGEIERLARQENAVIYICSITNGILKLDVETKKTLVIKQSERGVSPDDIMRWCITGEREPDRKEWIVLLDWHPHLKHFLIWRYFKDACKKFREERRKMILVSATFDFTSEIEKDVVLMDIPLPGREELSEALNFIVKSLEQSAKAKKKNVPLPTDDEKKDIIESARGLTRIGAENAFALSYQIRGRIDAKEVGKQKVEEIRKDKILDIVPTLAGLEMVGGNEELIKWLIDRKRAFSPEARAYGLPVPKGILMVGVQGCGKSLTAKTVPFTWNLPLLRLDAGRLFGGIIGESESNTRNVIQISEAVAPVVLWIDEIEKGLAMPVGEVRSGGEVTKHVVGTFLSWMQDKTSPVFVIATSNDITALPPEMLRKGRFDEIFFVDLPSRKERVDITRIIVQKHGRKDVFKVKDHEMIASVSDGFSGAEIEQALIEAMTISFSQDREVNVDDVCNVIESTNPISVTMKENVNKLRDWAKGRARWASRTEKKAESRRGARVIET